MSKHDTFSGRNRPIASYAEQRPQSQEDLRELHEQQKRADDQARIEAIKQKQRSKLAEMLKQKIFIREWTHPCLLIPGIVQQLSVSEFYPDLKLAVDKFMVYDDHEIKLTEHKKKRLNEWGFKYVVLTPDKDLSDILPEIEAQEALVRGR